MFYVCVTFLLLISCDKEENQTQINKNDLPTKMEAFFGSTIGKINGDKILITVSKEDLLYNAKNAISDSELDLQPFSFEVIKENNKNYLRIYSKKNYVSTIELLISQNKYVSLAETSCTSIACASGGGCVPDGLYCTKCVVDAGSPYAPDCKRTTTEPIDLPPNP